MTKTPEQMAEEYVAHNRSYPYAPLNAQDRYMRNSYLAGYQAAQTQWISVKERLPDRDQEVLGYEKPFISTCLFWKSRSFLMEHQWELSNGRNCNPTHWMPLPKPPEDK